MKSNCILVIISIFSIVVDSCKNESSKENTNSDDTIIVESIDTSIIAIMPFDTLHAWDLRHNLPAELTIADLRKIDLLLVENVHQHNQKQEIKWNEWKKDNPKLRVAFEDMLIDLERYKRQYIATVNSKKEKEVWINCFCKDNGVNWRQNVVSVCDGGNCYFQLIVNLNTYSTYYFIVNGEA